MKKLLLSILTLMAVLPLQAIEPGSAFPKMKQVKTTVFISCGGATESPEAQHSCRIFQGIINRDSAEVFLSTGDKEMDWWKYIDVDWKRPPKGVITSGENRGLRTMFKSYADRLDKLVVCNFADNDYTFNMAVLMACAENALPVSEKMKDALVSEFGWDKEIVDIRNRWSTISQAYNWALEEIMPKLNKQLVVSAGLRDDWRNGGWRIYDYAVASQSFTFWVDDKTTTGKNIIKKILRTPGYPKNAVVLGYGMHGDDLNDTTNPEGFGYVVGDFFPNASYYSSFPTENFENWQPEGKAVDVKPGKIYVALYWSDGDNIMFNHNLEHIIWSQKERGQVPVSMTIAPALCEIAPFILRYYHETATPNDELIGGPSGAQYIQEPFYKPADYESWCEMNGEYLQMGGLRSTNSSLRFPVQPFYNNGFVKSNVTGTIAWSSGAYYDAYDWCGMPVVCGGGVCGDTNGIYNYLKNIPVNDKRPLFTGVYMVQAGLSGEGYAGINKIVQKLNEDFPGRFEFLRASDLLASVGKYFADRRTPFKDLSIPGVIEAEDFDNGGQGAGFYDFASRNEGEAYRNGEGDCVGIGEGASGYHVGWSSKGEWLNYTVDIDAAAAYEVTLHYATSPGPSKSVTLMLDDEVLSTINLPATSGNDSYADVTALVNLPAGTHSLRMMLNDAGIDLDYYKFERSDEVVPEISPEKLYKIVALHSGKSLSLKDDNTVSGTRVVQRDFTGDDTQLWHLDVAGAYCYGLRNRASGMNIVLRGASMIGQFDFDCTNNLGKWNLRYMGDDEYVITQNESTRSLAIAGASLDDEAELTVIDDAAMQRFAIVPVETSSGIGLIDGRELTGVYFDNAASLLHIPAGAITGDDMEFRLYDLAGAQMLTCRPCADNGNNEFVISLSHLGKGIYVWELSGQGAGKCGKIAKTY